MALKHLLYVFTIFVFLISCRKEKTFYCDTINPGSYFPAYPNSWWQYTKSSGGNYTIEIDSIYHPIKQDQYCVPKWITGYYAPWYIEQNGLTRFDGGAGPGTAIWWSGDIYQIDTVGKRFYSSFGFGRTHNVYGTSAGGYFRREIIDLDSSLTVNGQNYTDVLVISEIYMFDSSVVYYDYFKEDVGLIMRDSMIPSVDSTLYEVMYLNDYFIGN